MQILKIFQSDTSPRRQTTLPVQPIAKLRSGREAHSLLSYVTECSLARSSATLLLSSRGHLNKPSDISVVVRGAKLVLVDSR
jgi:hypothetical protein